MAGRARGAQARANMTNLEKYRDNEQFNAMLQRIGVNRAGVNHIAADDFLSMDVLVNQYKSDIDEFSSYIKSVNKTNNNVRFSPVVTNRLIAVLHYFIQAVTCFHIIPDIELITRDSTPDLMDSYSMFKQFKDEDADDEVIIDLPTLKGHENWVHFRDKFLSNLSNSTGSNGTPLLYVVNSTERQATTRNQRLLEQPTLQLDSWDIYHEQMIHFGPHFKRDNLKVWQLIKKSLLGTHPYHHVDHCARQEDGRRAWEALRAYYEGEDYINRTIQECLTKVRTMYYRGETPRFNFEKFIDRQKECYKRLRDVGYNNGLGLDDASKCSNLKQMILPEAQLENALSMARTQGLFSGSFDDLVHFLKAEVDEMTLRRTQVRANRSHRISSVRGRGGYRGGDRNQRGGRGHSRQRNWNQNRGRPTLSRIVDGRRVHSGNYSTDEYQRLSQSQRDAVRDLRRQAQQQSNEAQNRNDQRRSNRNPNISAISTSGNDGEVSPNDEEEQPTDGTVRFAPSGSVGSYLGNRRSGQGFRENAASE